MKAGIGGIFLVLFVSFVTLASFFEKPVSPNETKKQEFVITKGEGLDQIADNLSRAKLIRSRLIFKFTIFRLSLTQKIQAGYFYLSASQSTGEIAKSLTKATAKQIWITIPEGLRREEIANLFIDRLQQEKVPHKFNPEEFINATKNLEGHLFPNTYAFAPNVTTQEVIDKLTAQFDQVIKDLNIAPNELNRVLTLASLIEREAGADSERGEIAAILNKRLKNNWALQADAAVQYAVSFSRCRIRVCDWWPKSLTKTDLTINSPYNTYKNTGLPPAPIGNPGKASLKAAVNPKETKNWFYLHDPNGVVHYAETIEQHNQNICVYLKKDC